MCSVFWFFWLSYQYLPSDWIERLLWGSLIVARDRLQKAQAEECAWFSWYIVLLHCFIMYLCCLLPLTDIFRLTSKSRPNNIRGGKCPYVRPYVRPSTKSSFDLNEIWYLGRGRWVMHDGMPYGRIQGQGHEPFKVLIPSIFKTYLLRHLQWELASDH